MRAPFALPASAALVLLAAACGQGQDQGGGANGVVAAPQEPAQPTDAQKKKALASLPAAYQGADLDNGEAKFALCRSCHSAVLHGGNLVGPNLYNVFGRRAGTLPGFAYSDALKVSKIVWNANTLDTWVTNPRADVAGTKMTFLGVENPKDRTDLIAYLKVITTPPGR